MLLVSLLSIVFFAAFAQAESTVPEGTTEIRDAWYPTESPVYADNTGANKWQLVNGTYFDGAQGSTTQRTNSTGSVIVRKNVIPTDTENIFDISLKVRAQASWADALDATQARVQNGNSDTSSKVDYFKIRRTSPNDRLIYVYFVNAPDNTADSSLISGVHNGSYKIVYRKAFYVDPSITGQMFLYFRNPVIGMGDHGGQKQNIVGGSKYYIPIGTTMQNYDLLYHAAVAKTVTDVMGEHMQYVSGSVQYNTEIPGVSGRTSVSASGNTLTWQIEDDGTIPIGEDYKLVSDTVNGKTVFYREYDLVYKAHLDASSEGFQAGTTYATNQACTLQYCYDPRPLPEDSDYQDYERGNMSLDFPQPAVKGTLYNVQFKKVDESSGKALAGARFSLKGSYGVNEVTPYQSDYDLEAVSDEDGIVTFTHVPWGRYTMTETSPPYGYQTTYNGESWDLCYTTNPGILSPLNSEYLLKASQVGQDGLVSDASWPKAKITLRKEVDNADSILSETDRATEFPLSFKITIFRRSPLRMSTVTRCQRARSMHS